MRKQTNRMHSHLAFGGLHLVTGVALVAGMTVGYAPRAQAQAFSPAEIKGLTIWLDASDINGNGTKSLGVVIRH